MDESQDKPPDWQRHLTLSNLGKVIRRNLANTTSVLGVVPLCLLLTETGVWFLPGLIVYNNVMDDLDGILAVKLRIKSQFGAVLDNVCDAVSHVFIVMVVGALYGKTTLVLSALPVLAILIRVVSRLLPLSVDRMSGQQPESRGTPTNELMRHLLFVVLLERAFGFDPTWPIAAVYLLNSVSMLVPFSMPHPIRSRVKTTTGIVLVNIALLGAWLAPSFALIIAVPFLGTFLYSLGIGAFQWRREM